MKKERDINWAINNILNIENCKSKRMKRAINSHKSCGLSFKELMKELSK